MTNPTPEAATFAPMTFHRLPLALLAAATLTAPLRAQDPDLRELLRDALYTEEVTRDPEAAAKQYEALLSKHDAQRAFAASALFRLAEVRRKQDRKDEAIALYQRLLREFPAAAAEGKLARENLAALGKDAPAAETVTADWETSEIERLEKQMANSPDAVMKSNALVDAVSHNHPRVVRYLLEAGADSSQAIEGLVQAASQGHLVIVKIYLEMASDRVKSGLSRALSQAVQNGNTQVAKALLDAGAPTDFQFTHFGSNFPDRAWDTGTPLMVAIRRGGDSAPLVDMLLDAGADVKVASKETGLTPLHFAASSSSTDPAAAPRWIERMIDAGADPNALSIGGLEHAPRHFKHALSPLQLAVIHESWESARVLIRRGADLKQPGLFDPFFVEKLNDQPFAQIRFLLENGADANQPGLLAELIDQGPDAIPLIQLLLESGCDPNAADPSGVPPIMQVFFWNLKSLENGNEKFAEHLKQVELIQLLLKHGADIHKTDREGRTVLFHAVDQNNLEAVNLLLAKGADPNRSSDKASILSSLAIDDQPEHLGMLKALLKAGIDPNLADQAGVTLLQRAVAKPTYQAVHLLVEHGAQPPEDWINGKFDRGSLPIPDRRIQGLLIRHSLFPRWMKEPAVRLSHPDSGSDLILAERIGDAPVPPLARLLVDWDGRVEGGPPNRISGLLVHRSNADGSTTTSRIAINSPEPYPELQWGDVLEVEKADPEDDGVLGFGWHPETRIALYRHLSFPVTVELPGSIRQIKIVGGRLTYDPAANEAPWVGAGALVWLLWNPTHSTRGIDELGLTVKRSGWPDVSLKFSDPNCWSFRLEPGDTLSLNLPPDFDQRMATARKTSAALRIAGAAVTRVYGTSETSPLPTLAQAITDAYGFWDASSFEDDYERHEGQIVRRIRSGSLAVPVDIPRPDFSRIRLRRLDASGVETVTVIDWEKLIRESGAAMTAADARGQDIDLKAGDIVEIALKDDRFGDQWKGFTPDETRFFSLALASRFQVVDGNGRLQLREFRWSPPDWKLVEGHLLPFPPKSGFLSARASRIGLRADFNNGQTRIRLVRGEKIWDNVGFDDFFVRDGDQISKAPPIQRPSR